ncbi:endonuclease domain-containing protein [Candidatus Dojkabacteria bacterium]|uniref:Endonuclease domain-containing protein n=1 Tax=Candidatus Dojkabacteria bacterium TaxID=2099670 RepID=A0A955I4Y5_9BACT|nr:endonuclease domain-containing protein [Candidatus Dojkabacteria bacterium]
MKLPQAYTSKRLTIYARENRKKQTAGERKLWYLLRNRGLLGYKFRRQVPIMNYIADFYSEELKLVIEIDGASHDEAKYKYDVKRQEDLEKLGIYVLRFSEHFVVRDIHNVVQTIENYVQEGSSLPTSSQPSPGRRRR